MDDSRKLHYAKMALRYIYERGLEHSEKRPTWLNQTIDSAWKPIRDDVVSRNYPPHDSQVPH